MQTVPDTMTPEMLEAARAFFRVDQDALYRGVEDTLQGFYRRVLAAAPAVTSQGDTAAVLAAALRELVRCVRGGDMLAGVSMDDALQDADAALAEAEAA